MPRTLYVGSQGQDVVDLQAKLNERPPSELPALVVDGIFGSKTLARVKEFQAKNGLMVDGIVGPKTWEALLAPTPSIEIPPLSSHCGNGDALNSTVGNTVKQLFASLRKPTTRSASIAPGMRFANAPASTGGGASTRSDFFESSNSPIRMLTPAQVADAQAVYGNSIDFSRVFISNFSGLQSRPFTVAFPDHNQVVQIINCGTFSPSNATLIHELAHVWQSQHSADPKRFMQAAVDCQAAAVAANTAELFSDLSIRKHPDYPVNYPYSAYAYFPGMSLGQYGAEQMAQACELGEKKIRDYMRSVRANAVDPENEAALQYRTCQDRRLPGVKI